MIDFELARRYANERLENGLAPYLSYHNVGHTRDEVVPAVELLAELEGLKESDRHLLRTAAWFHDLGYVEQATHHELIGARLAVQALPAFGYSAEQIEVIRWAILATALPQSPSNLLEQILTDADLAVLGSQNFLARNDMLRQELAALGKEYPDSDWYLGQLKFIEGHRYFTASAHNLWDAGQLENMHMMREKFIQAQSTRHGRR